MNPDLRGIFFSVDSSRLERCFAPGMTCEADAIRAHSIQNARQLDLLVEDGHVVQMKRRVQDGEPAIAFGRVGRNRATTFTGLCSEHDRELFLEIDNQVVEVADDWHRFLLAYRGVLRETHAVCEAAAKIQAGYRARVDAGLDPGDRPSPAGIFAVERMAVAWETHCYKEEFDAAFLKRDPSVLQHDVIDLEVERPSVAASALFSLDGAEKAGQTLMVALTILPLNPSRTVVVFSYLRSHAEMARLRLAYVLRATGPHQMYEISRQLLNSCENFVLSPSFVASWSREKRDAVLNYWIRTLMKDDLDTQDRDLMLFAIPP